MPRLSSLVLCGLASIVLCPALTLAQQATPASRITQQIDESNLVTLHGNIHPEAIAKNDQGAAGDTLALPDLTLVLSRSTEQQAAFDAFVASQYDATSPNFHQWLTPSQIGERFGPSQADIAAVTAWLTSHGFTVKSVSPARTTIRFSGTAAQIRTAFHTQIHTLSVNGVTHIANMSDPQIPAALAPVVVGVKALHNFLPHPQHKLGSLVQFNRQAGGWQHVDAPSSATAKISLSPLDTATTMAASRSPHPLFGINGSAGTSSAYLAEDVAPYDFATIYNVLPLWNNSINGAGQTIAIAGTSFITLSDVATFRSAFGLSTGLTPVEIDAGSYFKTGTTASICTSTSSSAYCGIGDLTENSLDVEWSGAVAPGAQIDLVATGQNSSGTIDTLFDSAAYIVDNLTAPILSVSYGECELGQGTSGNVAWYDLWQQAASEGISVFVATGDSGAPACDDNESEYYGYPYVAQYGLSVNGIASSPYNTAVGGTDFSWCQPYYYISGNNIELGGCPTSSTSQGSPAYWNTSNNSTTGASAAGYVPEIPWNDTCENPIWARYIQTLLTTTGYNSYYGITTSTPEQTCNAVYQYWKTMYSFFYTNYSATEILASFVNSVGGSGGRSNCVVNSTSATSLGSCTSTSTTTGSSYGNIALSSDGWTKPSWQTGVTGIPSDGVRDMPDVSFFSGDGSLSSATLICVSYLSSCTYSSSSENTYQEVGGTSVATPEMAGVMALINQKSGGAQGNPNSQLYSLATKQTWSNCSAESATASGSCYFQDVDYGPTPTSGATYNSAQTIAMPCNLSGTSEGGVIYSGGWYYYGPFNGAASPNCAALTSGDSIGTLVSSGATPGFNSTTGYDLATGLGSMNVANVVNAWVSDLGTAATTITVTPSSSTISLSDPLTVTVSVTGASGTPTGFLALSGGGYGSAETIGTSPCTSNTSCTFTIPAYSLSYGSAVTLTVYYRGNSTYASNSQSITITVNALTPSMTVNVPATAVEYQYENITVSVVGPSGAAFTPTGTISTNSDWYVIASTIGIDNCKSNTNCTLIIAPYTTSAGYDPLIVTYSGDSHYSSSSSTTQIYVYLYPQLSLSPANANATITIDQPTTFSAAASGYASAPTGTMTLSEGTFSMTETVGTSLCSSLTSSSTCTFTIPANSLTVGMNQTFTLTYSGDSYYSPATSYGHYVVYGSTPSIKVSPAQSSIDTGQNLNVTVAVTGSGSVPTGTIKLSGGGYTSSAAIIGTSPCTSNTTCVFTIPANALYSGANTITATYSGDSYYASGTGTASVAVTQSIYTLSATTPSAINPGTSSTSTITGATSSTAYTGTVTLSSCALTSSPSGAVSKPTCSVSGTITYSAGTPTGSGTATVYTTAARSARLYTPKPLGKGPGWIGAGSGAAFAMLVFFWIPARRRTWRALLGLALLLSLLGSLSACGGGGGSSSGGGGGSSIPATTAGSYTFTVTGVGNDPASTTTTTTFTVTVN